jgi:hypothetical protein
MSVDPGKIQMVLNKKQLYPGNIVPHIDSRRVVLKNYHLVASEKQMVEDYIHAPIHAVRMDL